MAATKRPRLPGFTGGGYQPPPAVQTPAASAQADEVARFDQEIYQVTLPLPANGVGAPGTPGEVQVYKTKRPWLACDVFVRLDPPLNGFATQGLLSVFVYAWAKGVRSLVGSGRLKAAATTVTISPFWIAAGRAVAEAFEVTIQFTQANAAPVIVGQVDVSVVASNDAVQVPDDLGAANGGDCFLTANAISGLGVNIAGVQLPSRLELLSVRAINGAAAPRFLQLHDLAGTAVVPLGAVPLMSWPMGATIGDGIRETRVRYRSVNTIKLVVSSTMNTHTAQVDGSVGAQLR